jgi:hypothetical protein
LTLPAQGGPGGPGAFVYSGRTDFLIGATGSVTVIRAEGTVRDICAALQPAD